MIATVWRCSWPPARSSVCSWEHCWWLCLRPSLTSCCRPGRRGSTRAGATCIWSAYAGYACGNCRSAGSSGAMAPITYFVTFLIYLAAPNHPYAHLLCMFAYCKLTHTISQCITIASITASVYASLIPASIPAMMMSVISSSMTASIH